MKYLIYTLCCALCVFFASGHSAHADVIPEDMKFAEQCIMVVNPDALEGVVLIGHITGPITEDLVNPYVITANTCLEKGYKLNSLDIYAGNPEDIENITAHTLLIENIEAGTTMFVPKDSVIAQKNAYYILSTSEDTGEPQLYLSEIQYTYTDGTSSTDAQNTVTEEILNQEHDATVDVTQETQEQTKQRSLWGRIVCFFTHMFGFSCDA
jgi:hypothetical protein